MTLSAMKSAGRGALIGALHERHVAGRRVRRLADLLAGMLPPGADVVDVGCGDGTLAREIVRRRPDTAIRGLDVLVRPESVIAVEPFDGAHLPLGDASVNAVLLVDVLHHTLDPMQLLRESRRVARDVVIIKVTSATQCSARSHFVSRMGGQRTALASRCYIRTGPGASGSTGSRI